MLKEYLKIIRIPHWIKNIFVFVPLVFSHNITNEDYLIKVIFAFIAFSLTSSIVYVFNDILDVNQDKIHPVKKYRPLASGKLTKKNAIAAIVLLVMLLIPFLCQLNNKFNFVLTVYALINIAYSVKLKNVVILDLMIVAAGFMLRVLAGAYVIDVYVSNWLILTTLFLSLFLAVMKRKSEMSLVNNNSETRLVLKEYTPEFINQISSITASGVIICYALYTVSSRTVEIFNSEALVYTTIFVVFGLFRYMYLVLKNNKGENVIDTLLTDMPTIINSIFYLAVIFYIIYIK